jgi:hypothetical protein
MEQATAVRKDGSNACAHRVAANERRVTHTNARNVRDCIVLTGLKDAGPNPEVARAGRWASDAGTALMRLARAIVP